MIRAEHFFQKYSIKEIILINIFILFVNLLLVFFSVSLYHMPIYLKTINNANSDSTKNKNKIGLIMLIGIIMYISLFKSEIGSKLRPKSVFQAPQFTFTYGHSFILFVIGCISAEFVGTMNFFLFIRIREVGREKVSCIHVKNIIIFN